MPIFEYKCHECGTRFEKIQAAAVTGVVCARCDSPHVERLLSAFAVGGSTRPDLPAVEGPCGSCGARERGLCPG
jgi:putative FmdB family regulatory protein